MVQVLLISYALNAAFPVPTWIFVVSWILFEESVVKKLFLPEINDVQTVNGILCALENEGYLVSTNGHKKPTTVYCDNSIPTHISFIAFRFVDMVSDETLKYIDNLSNKILLK